MGASITEDSLAEVSKATNEACDGPVCVGTPTDDVELRCVFAGAGVTSLDPDELTSVIADWKETLSTLTAAAGMRDEVLTGPSDADLVLLPLLFIGLRFWPRQWRKVRSMVAGLECGC